MVEIIRKLQLVLSKKQKRQIVILVIIMVISAFLEVCGISTVIPIISALLNKDFMFTNHYAAAVCGIFGITSYNSFVVGCVALLLGVFLVKNGILIFKNFYQNDFALEFQHDLRERIFVLYMKKDYQFFLNTHTADVNRTVLSDVESTYYVLDNVLRILTDIIVDVFLTAAIIAIDWKLSLCMLAVLLVIFFGITFAIRPIIKKAGNVSYCSNMIRNKWVHQAIEGIKTVKITEKSGFFEEMESETDLVYSKAQRDYRVLEALPKMIIEMLSITSLVILIVVFALSGDDFQSMIPSIGAIGMASVKILPALNQISSNISGITFRLPSITRITELLKEAPEAPPAEEFPDTYDSGIEVSHLSFRYDAESRLILDDVSLEVPVGKMVGIVGPSGEGKTTFVDVLLGLLYAQEGSVSVDGTDIRRNIAKWRKSISYITQSVFLLDDSIRVNVAFGVKEDDIDEEAVWEALEKAQIADFVRSLPNGIDTKIGERGVRLSGGQCQRLGIARALYSNPQIIIFDEATSSLDSETETAVVEAINRLYGKHTIIVIAHRSKALERCDVIYKIINGKLTVQEMQHQEIDGVQK